MIALASRPGRPCAIVDRVSDDADLIRRCVSGDAAAWADFVRKYVRLVAHVVRATLLARTGRAAEEDVDDLAHDFYAGLVDRDFRVFRALREPYNLRAWLAVVARRRTLDHLKRRGIRTVSLDQPGAAGLSLRNLVGFEVDDAPDEEVRRALDGAPLNPKERLMISLYYFKGRGYADIAAIMDVPENSIGPTVRRALDKIREALSRRGWTP